MRRLAPLVPCPRCGESRIDPMRTELCSLCRHPRPANRIERKLRATDNRERRQESWILRACVKCGTPSSESYCPDHKPKPWQSSTRRDRLTVSGWEEQRRRKRILKRDMGICHVCDRPGADQVDHVVPTAEGGADEDWNLASIHARPCHEDKTRAEARRARA